MKETIFKNKYPVLTLEFNKSEVKYSDIDSIIEYLKSKIDEHPVATYITIFDHFAHTSSLKEHNIEDGIKAVKNIIFCFGKEIPNAIAPAVRPRSIAVTEYEDRWAIGFMQAPNDNANASMIEWIKSLKK